MEMNRKAFAEESHAVLRKQQGSLEKLRADNEALKTELAMEMRSHARPSDLAGQRKEALKLRDEIEQYTELVAQEKRTMTVTTEQVALMKQKILHTRKTMGGVNAARENQAMIQKQVRILENRLDKALVKFNEALAHNKRLRDDIDDLRRERVVFDSIYQKLDRVRVREGEREGERLSSAQRLYAPQSPGIRVTRVFFSFWVAGAARQEEANGEHHRAVELVLRVPRQLPNGHRRHRAGKHTSELLGQAPPDELCAR